MAVDEELAPVKGVAASDVPVSQTEVTLNFIDKVSNRYGDRYNLSKFVYKNSVTKSIVICPVHGDYLATPHSILLGNDCKQCSIDKRRFTKEIFIAKSKKKFGEDSLDYSKLDYVNSKSPVWLICKKHGEFSVVPNQHLQKVFPCSDCADDYLRKTNESFISDLESLYGDTYDFSKVVYTGIKSKVKVICRKHGEFVKTASNLLNQNQGCPSCSLENHSYIQHWNYRKRCELNEGLRKKPSVFYIVEISSQDKSESFLKVGVSTNLRDRFSHYRKVGLSTKELKVTKFESALEAANMEYSVLNHVKENSAQYVPKTKFKGWSECVRLDYLGKLNEFCEYEMGVLKNAS